MTQRPLYVYVIAVALVWGIILGLMRYLGYDATFQEAIPVCAGFALGMLAMYIAVHFYTWR